MRKASNRLVILLLLSLTVSFLFFGCDRGELNENKVPTISITSYEGADIGTPNETYPDSLVIYSRLRLYWHAVDEDGVVENYAYRLLDEDGTPIPTPGNSVIDTDNAIVPKNVLDMYGGGWVLHFKEGSLQETSLSEAPNDRKTIWTNQKYALLNLPASDADGNPIEKITSLEVICIDNRGGISEIASRKFKAKSEVPTCLLKLSKGALNNPEPFDARELSRVGTGIILNFSIEDSDPFVEAEADYYLFKVIKRDASTGEVILALPENDGWYNSKDDSNTGIISEFLLTKYTTPQISSDFDNSLQTSYTEVVAHAVDMAGIQSEDRVIRFAVKEGYHPATMFYPTRNYAIGDNHYIDYRDATLEEDPPQIEGRYATALFTNKDGFYSCLGSRNLKIWLRWGFHGQYGYKDDNSNSIITDSPYDSALNILLDEETDVNYYSTIEYYDIRLDGAPYYYPPLSDNIYTDESGTYAGESWLRVPVSSSIAQSILMTGLEYGNHIFEVRAVDLQGEVDPTPATYEFVVEEVIPASEKSGILIIDDDHPLNAAAYLSPETFVDEFYRSLFTNLDIVEEIDMYQINSDPNMEKPVLSPTDLNKFKLVVYHSDSPAENNHFVRENDVFSLYMYGGGNLLISGGASVNTAIRNSFTEEKTFFERFVDVSNTPDNPVGNFSQAVSEAWSNPFFIKALISDAYQTGSPEIDLELNPNIGFNTVYEIPRGGLGPVTYFPMLEGRDNVIASFGCKSVYAEATNPSFVPTPQVFETINMQPVAFKVNNMYGGSVYVFGFPLSYMESSELNDEENPAAGIHFETTKPIYQLMDKIYQEINAMTP